jgi:hypothetical protein
MRVLLLAIAGFTAAAVQVQSSEQATPYFPLAARIDSRIHLSAAERADIVRLVAQRTSQRIGGVWWTAPDKILICCGCYDTVADVNAKGGAGHLFALQRTASGWKIVPGLTK